MDSIQQTDTNPWLDLKKKKKKAKFRNRSIRYDK